MLKLTGSLLVFAGCALAWYKRMAERRRRQNLARNLLRILREMGETIRQRRTPLPALLESLSGRWCPEIEGFLQAVLVCLRRGALFSEAWRAAAASLPLPEGDRELFVALGEAINSDEQRAYKEISFTCERLRENLEERERQERERAKQSSALWFSAAALLVILLL